MNKIAERLMAVHTHTHTHTHTGSNLIDKKRVDNIYSKSAMSKNMNRLLFSKQKIFVNNLKKLLQIKNVY